MKYKVIVETVEGTNEDDKALITLETNSTTRAGAFVRDRVWKFNEQFPPAPIERVVSIEKDGEILEFGEYDWVAEAIKWLEINDWY